MLRFVVSVALLSSAGLWAADDPVIFKSDVALSRVDAQVLDRDGHSVTGLDEGDFVLKVDGKIVPIKNFVSENMPIDILLLLDVSGSMEPHVERIASAAQQALNVLAEKDRVAIMVFDTYGRIRLPFRSSHSEVTSELNRLIRSERFNGGTSITRSMVQAADYVRKEARPEARRAIVILTDDQTQDAEDEPRVEAALAKANAVLSFLQAPYEDPTTHGPGHGGGMGRHRGTWGSGGGGWPGSGGGGLGLPGGISLPGGLSGDPSHTAGTDTIAADSGGDTMRVDEASALEDTLARLRQRYALNFYMPQGQSAGSSAVSVTLSAEGRRRYPNAEIRSRRVFMSGASSGERSGPTVVTHAREPVSDPTASSPASQEPTVKRKRVAVNEDSGPKVNTVDNNGDSSSPAAPSTSSQSSQPATTPGTANGGWPRTSQTSTPPPKPN